MPLSYFRRPLFIATVLYGAVLWGSRERGRFDYPPPPEAVGWRRAPSAAVAGRVVSPLTENRLGQRVFVDAETIEGKPFPFRILVYLPRGGVLNERLRPGMSVLLAGRPRLPRAARNPGDFDERRFLWDRGTSWILAASTAAVLPGAVPWRFRPAWAAETVRRSMENRFRRVLRGEEAALLTGLVLGYRSPMDRSLVRAVQDAGVMHLLVPSGAKVAFVWLAAAGLGLALGLPPWARLGAAALIAGFYTLMVGADAPYARAFLAAVILSGGGLLGRESGAFQALVLSAAVLLIVQPRELFSAGFQMTYLAVGGLVLAMPSVSEALRGRSRPARRLLQLAAVGAVVQLMLWPTFAVYFGRGSLIGPLANMLLVPYSGALMAGGFSLWAAGAFPEPVSGVAAGAVAAGLGWFREACFFFAALPGAAVEAAPISPWGLAAYYLGASSLLVLPRFRAAGVLVSLAALAALFPAVRAAAFPRTEITLLSLPRSRPALIRGADGEVWLANPGGPAGTILKALRAVRVGSLDRVVVTGPARESWGGLERLSREVPIRRLEMPAPLGRLPRLRPIIRDLARRGTEVRLTPPFPGPWRRQFGPIALELGGPGGPRVTRGEAEYSTIATRLKSGALLVSIHGSTATLLRAQ